MNLNGRLQATRVPSRLRTFIGLMLVGLLGGMSGASATSVTVYDNTPGTNFLESILAVNAPTLPTVDEAGMRFRAGTTGYLESIVMPVIGIQDFTTGDPPNTGDGVVNFNVNVYASYTDPDGGFPVPATLLESISTGTPLYGSQYLTVAAAQTTLLEAGKFYFVTAAVTDPVLILGWYFNGNGVRGFRSIFSLPQYPGEWYTQSNTQLSAFRVTAIQPVPIPTAGWLFLSGLASVGLLRRRRA